MRSKAKLTTYEYDYGQMAVVAILKIDSKVGYVSKNWGDFAV